MAATKPPREDTSSEDGDVQAGAYNEGSGEDEAAVSAARRSYGAANNPKAVVSAIGRARTVRASIPGARYEGSGKDEAEASAARRVGAYAPSATASSVARRAHAASGPADDPKTMTPVARRAPMARVAVCAAEAKGSNDGARYEGSGDDEAEVSAAGRADASAGADADEATAVAARRTSLAARRASKGGNTDDGAFTEGSDNDKARASTPRAYASSSSDEASPIAARRGRAASAA